MTRTGGNAGLVRVAAATLDCRVADVDWNVQEIIRIAKELAQKGVQLMCFPELCITGYSIRDLVNQDLLLQNAKDGLRTISDASNDIDGVIVVGLPMVIGDKLFNIAAVVNEGEVVGLVPKSYLPEAGEFEEGRWYHTADELTSNSIRLFGQKNETPLGTNLIFEAEVHPDISFAIEICEDAWVSIPPGAFHALAGAKIILNPSASNELVGKSSYRRRLVESHSAHGICGYVYASAGPSESTTDVVFGGHCLIAENGETLTELNPFEVKGSCYASVTLDVRKLKHDRLVSKSFGMNAKHMLKNRTYTKVPVMLMDDEISKMDRPINIRPFTSENPAMQKSIVEMVFNIQVHALKKAAGIFWYRACGHRPIRWKRLCSCFPCSCCCV